jgi:hypothetical protein
MWYRPNKYMPVKFLQQNDSNKQEPEKVKINDIKFSMR